jgi:hypothetical protein
MSQNEIRVGIVGAGTEKIWAKVSHVPAIRDLAGHRLAAVALVLLFAAPRVRAEVAHAPLNLPDAPLANLPQTSAQTDGSGGDRPIRLTDFARSQQSAPAYAGRAAEKSAGTVGAGRAPAGLGGGGNL